MGLLSKLRSVFHRREVRSVISGGAVGITAIVVIFLMLDAAGNLTESVPNQLRLTDIIINSILTVILIVIYMRISRWNRKSAEEMGRESDIQESILEIQREQSDILDNQRESMRAQYAPNIGVLDYSAKEDHFQLSLKNQGNGTATDLKLVTELSGVPDYQGPTSGWTYLSQSKSEGEDWLRYSSISPNGSEVTLYAPPVIGNTAEGTNGAYMRAFTHNLSNSGVSEVYISFFLEYDDVMGNSYKRPIFAPTNEFQVQIEPSLSLETAVSRWRPVLD